jgi:glutathione S-transferase
VSFQISGLGPYVGQLAWFQNYHKEKIPSAIERYHNEAKRLFSVIEGHLQGKEYVNGTYSISDIAFFPWFRVSHYVGFDKETDFKNEYPNIYAWYHRVATRPAVVKAYEQSN